MVKSRIDRVLVSKEWLEAWPCCQQFVLNRSISDHCAIVLKDVSVDWGPRDLLGVWMCGKETKDLKVWNKEVFGDVNLAIELLQKRINELDARDDERGLEESEREERKSLLADLSNAMFKQEAVLHQKARQKWLKQGDLNTKFFHSSIKWRRARNELHGMFVDGWWCEDKDVIKDKDIIKADVLSAVKDFASKGHWPRGTNASFLCLVPKVENPQHLGEFRPISLVGCLYKIISKVLSLRLKKVISRVIDIRQPAFLEGRGLLDSVLVANEVLEEYKRKRKSCIFFKVDYEKAFDSVSWDFIYYMLERLGFCAQWIRWIKCCLESASVSVLVNGSPTREFLPRKGLRQGDPLAPFLFLIVAEELAGVSRMAEEKQLIDSLEVGKPKVKVNMLQFADDTLFFYEANTKSVFNIKAILLCFELAFGLKVNFLKSIIGGTGLSQNSLLCFATILNCKVMRTPFTYLGLPVGGCHKRGDFWNGVVVRVQGKLSRWKGKCKWIWRLGSEKGGMWKEILDSKYGGWRSLREDGTSRRSSLWWKDLKELVQLLQGVKLDLGEVDSWGWKVGGCQTFTVNSAYVQLRRDRVGEIFPVYSMLWRCNALPSALYTAWRVMENKIATRVSLVRRGVVVENSFCCLCGKEEESSSNLFSTCNFVWRVWSLCFEWLGISSVIHKDPKSNFLQFRLSQTSNSFNVVWSTIWVGVVSEIWKHRNSVIFNRGVADAVEVFASMQVAIVSEIWNIRNSVIFNSGVADVSEVFASVQVKLGFKFFGLYEVDYVMLDSVGLLLLHNSAATIAAQTSILVMIVIVILVAYDLRADMMDIV
ncbi:uncharacterized protein [Phaseolus vulgaris]|uniref:uncharacterized protein n=1 Tax=Phaseolus vulgaris TaxID=3885 RepID=UPI0035CA740C